MKKKILDEEIIGKRFKSKSSNWFTVLSETEHKSGRMKLFEIEFDEINNVSYKYLARKEDILKGSTRNPFYPSVYGIGYVGNSGVRGNETQYHRWKNMISRCYNPYDKKYLTYGEIGVRVCDRWLCFENYLEDFDKIEGYDKNNLKNLAIDKDIKFSGNKLYSLDRCKFVTISENSSEMNCRVNSKVFIAVSPYGEVFESSNQREFAREHELKYVGINDVLCGRQATHKKWKFYFKGD